MLILTTFNSFFLVLSSVFMGKINEVEQHLAKNKGMVDSYLYGRHKRTLLHKAAEIGDRRICNLLIDYHADVNKEDVRRQTLLWIAAKKGHGDICDLLIRNGAIVNKDAYEKTPLWIAASKAHEGVCKILINNGADLGELNDCPFYPNRLSVFDIFQRLKFWHSEYGKMFKRVTLFIYKFKIFSA